MSLAFVGLGSNLGSGPENLQRAWRLLGREAGIVALALSSPYCTVPVSKPEYRDAGRQLGEQSFTNAVGILETRLEPVALLRRLQEVERQLGRDRGKTLDRPIDLDLLYYDNLVLELPELTLPHPELARRLFVLAPLEELAPEHVHPGLGLTTREMRRRLPARDERDVRRISWDRERRENGC